MIKLEQTGKISKNENNELCMPTVFTVSISIADVTYDNVDVKVAELIKEAGTIKALINSNTLRS
jgi:hypothetical protein